MKELMHKFWANQRARGAAPLPLYAAVSLGREQPRGYIIGWTLTRQRTAALIARRHDPADWEIVEFTEEDA